MATWLKQSTAVDVMFGPFVDATDGVTPETALSITQPDILLSKNGGAFAQKNASQTLSHGSNGWYPANLNATDTNTLGSLVVAIYESGALPVWREFMVVPANVWDSFFGADKLEVDQVQLLGTAVATPTVAGVQEVDITHFGGVAGTFASGRPEVNASHWKGGVIPTPTITGTPLADVSHWLGTAAQGASGRPQVDLELWLGAAPNALSSGRVDATVGAMQTDVLTDTALAASAVTEMQAGLATAAVVAAIQAKTDLIPGTLDGKTFAEITQLVAAVLCGKVSGMGSNAPVFRSLDDTANRVSATTDASGNRTAVTLNNA